MNSTIQIGRLIKDPELKFIPSSGTGVCNFTLAVDKELSKSKKAEFEASGKPTADFIPVVVFGKIAESCANFLAKGRMVAVSGSIQTRTYVKDDGSKRYITEVLARNVQFLEWGDKPKQKTTNDAFPDFTDTDIFEPTDGGEIPWE